MAPGLANILRPRTLAACSLRPHALSGWVLCVFQGVAVELLLRTIEKKKPVDFVLCVGDDRSDEVCLDVCLDLVSCVFALARPLGL